MKKMKKQLAVAVTVALLTLPFGTSMVLAETDNPLTTTTTTSETTTDVATTDTTADDATADGSTTDDTTTDGITTDDTTTDATTDDTTTDDATTDDTTTDDTQVTDADGTEVAPSNWFTNLIGKLQLALTFDPVRKSELSERQALAKLARAQKLMSEGKIEAAEIALIEYSDKITKAQEFLEQVEDPDSEKAIKLNIALTNVNSNNINVLSNLLEKLPPQAAQKLALNVVRSMEKAVKKIEKQEAKVALTIPSEETISETVPATTAPATESVTTVMPATKDKSLEKQAKIVLKDFKKSLKENGTIQLEEVEQSDDEDNDAEDNDTDNITLEETAPVSQEPSNRQPTSVTVAPAQLEKASTTSNQSSVRDNKKQTKRDEPSKEKSRDNGGDKKAKSDKRD